MADDYKFRSTRSNDPLRSAAEPPRSIDFSASSDPLAELARLIGQADPLTEYGRTAARAPQPRDLPPRDLPPRDLSPRELLERELSQRELSSRQSPSRAYPASQATPEWPPSFAPSSDRRYDSEPRDAARAGYPAFGDFPPSRSAAGRDPLPSGEDFPGARGHVRDSFSAPSARDDYPPRPMPPLPLDEPRWAPREEARWPESQAFDSPPGGSAPHQAVPASEHRPVAAASEDDGAAYDQDDAPLLPEDEEGYDDPPGAGVRRSGIATAIALIFCALLGTAGAYAYRSYAHPTAKEPPPVISADNSNPAKLVPPAGEARSGKQISERFATAAAGSEQLVSRQEEPVALREPGTATAPRVVLPAPVQPTQPAPVPPVQAVAPPPAATPPAPQPPAATAPGSEPKRVRTVTIRPDGSDPSSRPVNNNTTPPAPRATGTTPPAPRAAAPQPAPPRGGGPLSLQPNETRVAPPPGPLSSFSSSGGYVVQLSSQKTESDAHSAFRALQAKFPNELGNRQVIIRRADLGAKGVVYRTNVGPFPTAQEAQRFCASYKAAGGQCIVPTN